MIRNINSHDMSDKLKLTKKQPQKMVNKYEKEKAFFTKMIDKIKKSTVASEQECKIQDELEKALKSTKDPIQMWIRGNVLNDMGIDAGALFQAAAVENGYVVESAIVNESYGDELDKLQKCFDSVVDSMRGSSAGNPKNIWIDLGLRNQFCDENGKINETVLSSSNASTEELGDLGNKLFLAMVAKYHLSEVLANNLKKLEHTDGFEDFTNPETLNAMAAITGDTTSNLEAFINDIMVQNENAEILSAFAVTDKKILEKSKMIKESSDLDKQICNHFADLKEDGETRASALDKTAVKFNMSVDDVLRDIEDKCPDLLGENTPTIKESMDISEFGEYPFTEFWNDPKNADVKLVFTQLDGNAEDLTKNWEVGTMTLADFNNEGYWDINRTDVTKADALEIIQKMVETDGYTHVVTNDEKNEGNTTTNNSTVESSSADEVTDVIFLVHEDPEFEEGDKIDLFAYFPNEKATNHNDSRTCYAHVGQHSSCAPEYAQESREATPDEYVDLKAELEGRGYKLNVLNGTEYIIEAVVSLNEGAKQVMIYDPNEDRKWNIFDGDELPVVKAPKFNPDALKHFIGDDAFLKFSYYNLASGDEEKDLTLIFNTYVDGDDVMMKRLKTYESYNKNIRENMNSKDEVAKAIMNVLKELGVTVEADFSNEGIGVAADAIGQVADKVKGYMDNVKESFKMFTPEVKEELKNAFGSMKLKDIVTKIKESGITFDDVKKYAIAKTEAEMAESPLVTKLMTAFGISVAAAGFIVMVLGVVLPAVLNVIYVGAMPATYLFGIGAGILILAGLGISFI